MMVCKIQRRNLGREKFGQGWAKRVSSRISDTAVRRGWGLCEALDSRFCGDVDGIAAFAGTQQTSIR